MLTDFQFTEECKEAMKVSLKEVRDRVTSGKDSRPQREHIAIIEWEDAGEDYEGRITTTVTNPTGTEQLMLDVEVVLPSRSVESQLHGEKHSLAEAGYDQVQHKLNEATRDILGSRVGQSVLALRSDGEVPHQNLTYTGELIVEL